MDLRWLNDRTVIELAHLIKLISRKSKDTLFWISWECGMALPSFGF